MPRRPSRLAALSAVVALSVGLAAVPASGANGYVDSVDLEVASSASVKGTIRGADERERLAMQLPEGAVVRAAAKRKGKSALVPLLDLVGDGDVAVPAAVVTTGKGSKLTSPPLPASGFHKLRVFGDGTADGDYSLTITAKPQAKWSGSGNLPVAGAPVGYSFAAPAGAAAKIVLRAAPGSAFVPGLDALSAPGGAQVQALTGGSTGFIPLPETGTYRVSFHDAGTAGGDWTIQVLLKLPKVRKSVVDISAARLTGQFVDGQPVYGRLAGDGAALEIEAEPGSSLEGTSITLQDGSLPVPVVITMSEVPPFTPPGGGNNASPAIQFGPPGTQFAEGKPATLTLPYDPNVTDPDSLTIYVRNEVSGEVVAVPKPYDFPGPGLVSFPAPHFSQYLAVSTEPLAPTGDWVLLKLRAEHLSNWGSFTTCETGLLSVAADRSRSWSLSSDGVQSAWFTDYQGQAGGPPGPYAFSSWIYGSDSGTLDYDQGSVSLYGSQTFTFFARGDRGDALLQVDDGYDTGTRAVMFLRKARARPTRVNLAGRWQIFYVSLSGEQTGPSDVPNPVRVSAEISRAAVVLGADGKASFSGLRMETSETDFPAGTWRPQTFLGKGAGSFVPQGDRVGLFFPDDGRSAKGPRDEAPLTPDAWLRACLGGDVLVGTTNAELSQVEDVALVVLVRESSGVAPALAANFATTSLAFDTLDRAGGVQGLRFESEFGVTVHDGAGSADRTRFLVRTHDHDAQGVPQSSFNYDASSQRDDVTVSATGALKLSSGVAGWVSRSGSLTIGTLTTGSRFQLVLGCPASHVATPGKR